MAQNKRVFFVSCVGMKSAKPAPAAELYISPWFLKVRQLVEEADAPWFILSAEHGVIAPETVVAPYNKTLNTMGVAERRAWAERVIQQMEHLKLEADEVVILAGARYRENLMPWFKKKFSHVSVPMEGLQIGRQLSWLLHAKAI
jgi:hypothetical protein